MCVAVCSGEFYDQLYQTQRKGLIVLELTDMIAHSKLTRFSVLSYILLLLLFSSYTFCIFQTGRPAGLLHLQCFGCWTEEDQ